MNKIRIGIVGYGNIGRGVEKAVNESADMELVAVFTRREPEKLEIETKSARVLSIDAAADMKGKIDVMLLCGGSATDLPVQGPLFAKDFNTVDSFDTHAKIPQYLKEMDAAARETAAIVSVGWDPGLFSMMRALFTAALPAGKHYTFWGRGVSQGHSDAIRRVEGVQNAIQYTVPIDAAVQAVRDGGNPELTTRQKHLRECYVVAKEGADKAKIERDIKQMPFYFDEYDTEVSFISEEELMKDHSKMSHGGMVLRSGQTGENAHVMEFSLKLESNPEFTASVMVAYARAAARFAQAGDFGAKTVLDVPFRYLINMDRMDLIKEML